MLDIFNFDKLSSDLSVLKGNQAVILGLLLMFISGLFFTFLFVIYYKVVKKRTIIGDENDEEKPVINIKKLKDAISL
mgnify:CR=1 FL=1|tara:strand:+ start:264 stop:494 length:231 start_codon:yes stop_codon:yes gene_type:complete